MPATDERPPALEPPCSAVSSAAFIRRPAPPCPARPAKLLTSSMKMMSASSTFTSLPTMVTRPTAPSLVLPARAPAGKGKWTH